jgi:hypothetical protein
MEDIIRNFLEKNWNKFLKRIITDYFESSWDLLLIKAKEKGYSEEDIEQNVIDIYNYLSKLK